MPRMSVDTHQSIDHCSQTLITFCPTEESIAYWLTTKCIFVLPVKRNIKPYTPCIEIEETMEISCALLFFIYVLITQLLTKIKDQNKKIDHFFMYHVTTLS